MNLEEKLKKYKEMQTFCLNENEIQTAIEKSKEAFYLYEQEDSASYHVFLWNQMKFIRKRWWVLQALLLAAFCTLMYAAGGGTGMKKEMSACSVLFILLVIPELWKNKENLSMEIECAAYYSLRQVYAARLVLFAMADIVMITLFCCTVSVTVRISAAEFMVQCLLPMSVTACICFRVLCSRWNQKEASAVGLCALGSGGWTLILLNEPVYKAISFPVWFALFSISLVYLSIVIHRTLKHCDSYLEEVPTWNLD